MNDKEHNAKGKKTKKMTEKWKTIRHKEANSKWQWKQNAKGQMTIMTLRTNENGKKGEQQMTTDKWQKDEWQMITEKWQMLTVNRQKPKMTNDKW